MGTFKLSKRDKADLEQAKKAAMRPAGRLVDRVAEQLLKIGRDLFGGNGNGDGGGGQAGPGVGR